MGTTSPLVRDIQVVGQTIPDYGEMGIFFPLNRDKIALMRDDDYGVGSRMFSELSTIGGSFNPLRDFVSDERLLAAAAAYVRANRGAVNAPPGSTRARVAHSIPRRGRH